MNTKERLVTTVVILLVGIAGNAGRSLVLAQTEKTSTHVHQHTLGHERTAPTESVKCGSEPEKLAQSQQGIFEPGRAFGVARDSGTHRQDVSW
jgi:hypothetical protein